MHITVLGATGGIGRAIATELVGRGHAVAAASRSAAATSWPTGVQALTTDLRDPASTAAACRDADVVVMAAQVPYTGWATELTPLFDAAVDAASAVEARLVIVDNLYGYGSPGTPLTEDTPQAATTRKGRLRAALGRRMLDAHAQGRCRVSIGRFSDYYGPEGPNSLLYQVGVKPAVAGRRMRTFIAGDQPHTFHYLPDAARGFAVLAERPEADGAAWILPAAPARTQGDLLALLADQLGTTRRPGNVSPAMLWAIGLFDAQMREAREVVAQFDRPYVTDASRFEATFGPLEVTDHRDALAATVAWERARVADAGPSRRGRTEVAA
ncbi:MAG: NAD(P)H-binding protein [Nitriliruptoraceae bacterium]|nr:NAD(P)H-binding protein [Nitriliruptoraceae bacterium]